jgi:1-acyl-sn-glycerol-3-phosphate acyltransferase
MISFNNIGQTSVIYYILKAYSNLMLRFFYRKIKIRFKEKISHDVPVIFAPNHQNALLDALLVHSAIPGPVIFLARSDIFKKDGVAKFLRLIKIMPVFRIRDGFSELQNNDEIFKVSVDLLRDKGRMGILPEGNHAGFKYLRQLKKGLARIALQTEAFENFSLGLKIYPVGLDYTTLYTRNCQVVINFGKAIEVKKYAQRYAENPVKAINELTDEIAESIIPEIINVPDPEKYEVYEKAMDYGFRPLCKLQNKCGENPVHRYDACQDIVKKVSRLQINSPEVFEHLEKKLTDYGEVLKKTGIKNRLFELKPENLVLLLVKSIFAIIGFPIFALAWLIHFFPEFLVKKATKKLKDPIFVGSFAFVVTMLIFLLYLPILYVVVGLAINNWLWSLLTFIAVPGLMKFYIAYRRFSVKTLSVWKFRFATAAAKSKIGEAAKLRNEILSLILN